MQFIKAAQNNTFQGRAVQSRNQKPAIASSREKQYLEVVVSQRFNEQFYL